jgi:hypothetical protein
MRASKNKHRQAFSAEVMADVPDVSKACPSLPANLLCFVKKSEKISRSGKKATTSWYKYRCKHY